MKSNFQKYFLVVVGFERGTGEFEYSLGSILCSFGDGTLIKCNDIPSNFRKAWWYQPRGVMGCVVEIEAERIEKRIGKSRFIRFAYNHEVSWGIGE